VPSTETVDHLLDDDLRPETPSNLMRREAVTYDNALNIKGNAHVAFSEDGGFLAPAWSLL
jgi:hypothetical protein